MKLPKSFKQVTVEQYQRIYPIYQKIEAEKDPIVIASDWCRIISILTTLKPNEVEELPIDKLKSIIKSLNWLVNGNIKPNKKKYLFVKGHLHRAKLEAKQFNTAQYVEIKTFLSRGNWISEMHNILATIYSPLGWKGFKHDGVSHPDRAEAFKKVSVASVYPTVFFYSVQFKDSMRRIQEYGLKLMKEKQKEIDQHLALTLREVLENIGDGIVR